MALTWYQNINKTQGTLAKEDSAALLKDNLKDRMMAVISDIKTEDVSWYNDIYQGLCATDAEVATAVSNGDFVENNITTIRTFLNASTSNAKYAHLLFPKWLHNSVRDSNSCTCTSGTGIGGVSPFWILNGRVYDFNASRTENNSSTYGNVIDVLSGEVENKHLDKLQARGLKTTLATLNRKGQIASNKTIKIAAIKNN